MWPSFTYLSSSFYFSDLFLTLVWEFNVLLNFLSCYYNFYLSYTVPKGRPLLAKTLPLFSQDGKLKPFMSLNLKSRVDHLKSDLRFWIYFSAFHLGHSSPFIIHIQYTHRHRYASCTQRLCSKINQY